jgi:bile acid:Na+ symporter, BASS family
MKDIILSILKVIAPLSVALIVFAQGLKISSGEVMTYFKERPWLIIRALAAVLILVPVVALVIIIVLKPPVEVVVALAILVSCPPAPLMIKATPNLGKGSAAFMTSLHLSLAVLALITVPTILYLISIPLSFHADVNLVKMMMILSKTILIPVILGMLIRSYFPAFADKASPVLDKVGTIGLLLLVIVVLIKFFPALLNMDLWSYLVIALVSASALAVGHFLGPKDPHERTSLAIESGVRHPALALTIGVSNYTAAIALPVLVPCVLVFIILAMLYMVLQKKTAY